MRTAARTSEPRSVFIGQSRRKGSFLAGDRLGQCCVGCPLSSLLCAARRQTNLTKKRNRRFSRQNSNRPPPSLLGPSSAAMMKVELASHAVALNLTGVLAMDASDYGTAIESFSRGLGALKRVITMQPDSAHGTQPPSSCCPMTRVPESLLENCFSFSEAATATRRKEKGGFVFRCPIAVAIASPRVMRCHRFHVMLSFALLYNLGLAHHLSALEEEEELPSDAQLQKALSLYELAFSVHVNEDVNLSVLQTMVIANNLGQVYGSVGASDKALQCCSHLLSLILYASGMCERDRPESLDDFVGNVMHLFLKDSGSNAPAA
jgi:hypothetical protein